MNETEQEYGCVRCQKYHGESDGPIYAEHIMHQSKHGLRRRPIGGWRWQKDLSYSIVLIQQALVLHDQHGTTSQWDRWAEEARNYVKN